MTGAAKMGKLRTVGAVLVLLAFLLALGLIIAGFWFPLLFAPGFMLMFVLRCRVQLLAARDHAKAGRKDRALRKLLGDCLLLGVAACLVFGSADMSPQGTLFLSVVVCALMLWFLTLFGVRRYFRWRHLAADRLVDPASQPES